MEPTISTFAKMPPFTCCWLFSPISKHIVITLASGQQIDYYSNPEFSVVAKSVVILKDTLGVLTRIWLKRHVSKWGLLLGNRGQDFLCVPEADCVSYSRGT